jgi:hypothetical protein
MLSAHKVLVASGLLLAALPAFAAEENSNNVAPASLPTAIVKCPGVNSIPMTTDAEQALPLHVIRPLACGEIVSVLGGNEGYTALVRTSDGHEGYVALVYLAERGAAPSAASVHRATTAKPVNGVVRWSAGAPGCDEFLSHGRHVESITTNGVTVQVSIQDSGWKYRANIAISNNSASNVAVIPGIVTLDELQPNLRPLPATNVKTIVGTRTHQALWTNANAVPSPSAVSAQQRSEAQRLAYRDSATPDYLNPHMTLASARPSAFERDETLDLQSIALKPSEVPQGANAAGVMWFTRDIPARELSMRVPVGDMVFDFAFAFDQKK